MAMDNSLYMGLFGGGNSAQSYSPLTISPSLYLPQNNTAVATGPKKITSPTGGTKAPTSPWSSLSKMPKESELVKNVLGGKKFISAQNVQLDVPGASQDYNQLFTLYQGVQALQGLASKAETKGISDLEAANIRRRFAAGMAEVGSYLTNTKYEHLSLLSGTLSQSMKSTVGMARTDANYKTDMLYKGDGALSVPAFEGDVKFTMTVNKVGTSTPFTIDFDLSEMGTDTRNMSNVVGYMNGKLEAAGVVTRFAVNRVAAKAETITAGGKTITVSKGADTFGLMIKGASYETVNLSAPAKADSVYVFQTSGVDPDKVKTLPGTTTLPKKEEKPLKEGEEKPQLVFNQLLKFQSDVANTVDTLDPAMSKPGETYWADGRSQQTDMGKTIAKVHASQAGVDGSVYVLADVNGTVDGQEIRGAQDVALMKYDSAGNLVFTRTLGASDQATGLALAVHTDGSVAVAGSVTGYLSGDKGSDRSVSDSFVTVFDAQGDEKWTQRKGAADQDEATALSFGADGSVFVGGRTRSVMSGSGAIQQGGWDNYMRGFSATGTQTFVSQGGTTGGDGTHAMTVDGSTLYVADNENGEVVLKSYDISGATPSLITSRNIGGLGGGAVTSLKVENGKLYMGGSSGSSQLLAGATQTNAYSGGHDAFALSVDQDLSQTGSDTIAFFGGVGNELGAKVDIVDGKAWIATQTNDEIAGTTKIGKKDVVLARLDIATGAIESQTRYSGKDGEVTPDAIAVAKNASTVLDRLGLPSGTIAYKDSTLLTSGTSVRAGDQFYIRDGSVKKAVTIDANETFESLAKKIAKASGNRLKADVMKIAGQPMDQLVIKPANKTSKAEFLAGSVGKDALEALGLSEGLVSSDANKSYNLETPDFFKLKKPVGLSFDNGLNLNSEFSIKDAVESLKKTASNIQKAYTWLKNGDPVPEDPAKKRKQSAVPSHITDQIANYQAALNRLTGGY